MTIAEIKIKVLNRYPFFGTVLYNLPVVEDKNVGTIGVDGTHLLYNPEYWNSKPPREQMALLIHEAGHLIFDHLWRGRNFHEMIADPETGNMFKLYNLAGDAVINLMIRHDCPDVVLPEKCFIKEKYKGMSSEEVYHDLLKTIPHMSKQEQKDFMSKFGQCNKDHWGDAKKDDQKKWEQVRKQAYEYAKAQGKLPASLQREFELMDPKEDWRSVLQEFVQPFRNDYSFNPSDRRFLTEDFVLPDISDGEKLDWIAVAIDTSGSISHKDMSAFISEVKGIVESYDYVKLKLTFCDAEATPFIELDQFDAETIRGGVKGGGGTDFRPVFNLIEKEDNAPMGLLYFTDGYGTEPNSEPEYALMWVLTTDAKLKTGRHYSYKI